MCSTQSIQQHSSIYLPTKALISSIAKPHRNEQAKSTWKMQIKNEETILVHPSKPPFLTDHVLSLSHLDTDRNLHITIRYLRVYVDNHHQHRHHPFDVITTALSTTLVHYYPFTGTGNSIFDLARAAAPIEPDCLLNIGTLCRRHVDNRLELHCQIGKGVPVVRSTADCLLSSVNYLDDDPNGNSVELLVPDPDSDYVMHHPMILQVTTFKCGGFVVGATIHHSLCDGIGATIFFNAIAELARGADRISLEPVWDRVNLLGPRNPTRIEFPIQEFLSLDENITVPYSKKSGEEVVRECFPVEDEWVDQLKRFLHQHSGSNFTTFEALGAFIWRAKVKASGVSGNEKVKFAYSTNIRKIVKPPLPTGYWGNGCVPMYVNLLAKELLQQPIWETADLIKKSKFNTTDDYVRSFIDFQELHYSKGINAGKNVSGFTDWRHLGHSTVDFGWGGPVTILPLSKNLLGSIEPCYFLPYSSAIEEKKNGFKVMVYLNKDVVSSFRKEMTKLIRGQDHGLAPSLFTRI